jgi:CHAD domain-containing protein
VRDLAPLLIYRRLAAVRAYAPLIEHAPIATLHMLRIEFKKLRYTVEYFQEVLGRRGGDVINTVKQLQDHLGAMNDAEVAGGLIEQFIQETEAKQSGLPSGQRVDLQETHVYLACRLDEREQLARTFPEAWQKLFLRPIFRRSLAQAVSVL